MKAGEQLGFGETGDFFYSPDFDFTAAGDTAHSQGMFDFGAGMASTAERERRKRHNAEFWERQKRQREQAEAERKAKAEREERERRRREREERERDEQQRREEWEKAYSNFKSRRGMTYESACDVLGVMYNADAATIKKAWRKLCYQHHPDRGNDAEQMKAINAAYDRVKGGR